MNRTVALLCSFLALPFASFALESLLYFPSIAASKTSNCLQDIAPKDTDFLSDKELKTLASQITVKVIGDNNGGSGTLLAKQGNSYLVITNSHVVMGANTIRLQTADGNTYSGEVIRENNFAKSDLVLLKFQTNFNYCVLDVKEDFAKEVPYTGVPVLASGFSAEKGKILFSKGTVEKVPIRALKEGYQIGYTSNIEQGMSGGPIINSMGMLIGINGKSAYPILNTGYVYPDGSRPTDEEIKEMRTLSWGIPVRTFLAQVNVKILNAYGFPLPATVAEIPSASKLPPWLQEINEKAKQFTVRIDSGNDNGSGIIITKEGNTYTVLTAAHVVCERQDATQPCENSSYTILAPDGKKYDVDKNTIKRQDGVDLAVLEFTSQEEYEVATLADYNPNNYDYIFTVGYPNLKNTSPWRFTMGQIFSKGRGLLGIKESDFQSNSDGQLENTSSLTGGYELVYSSITYGGMSGGPVLDSTGRVIGIHGRAEGEEVIDKETGEQGINKGKIQIGYSLGIPISTFVGLATRFNVKPQNLEKIPASPLSKKQANSIQAAILSIDIPQGNATAIQWLERGNQLWRLRRHKEAVQAFEEVIKLKPSFVYLAYYGKGLALGEKAFASGRDDKYQEALQAFEKVVKIRENYTAAWLFKSAIYRKLNKFNKALIAINKAIKNQPANPILYNEKWSILRALGQYEEAVVAISKAINISPRAEFFNNRGIVNAEQNKKSYLILSDLNKAIQINPNNSAAYNNRGNIYTKQKKWKLALADYNKAIEINSKYFSAYYGRGNLYAEQKKWKLALDNY
ncbi:MAG: tetratricopeptide repeat-containing serine protease family protein, partial [Cyanobacteria bacterium P01_A01_bin.68]